MRIVNGIELDDGVDEPDAYDWHDSLNPERDAIWEKHCSPTPALCGELLEFSGKMEQERNMWRHSARVAADEAEAAIRLRWRKESIRYGPKTHKLSRGGELLAVVQECKGGWFWYGGGRNTARNPTDLETAKSEALAHIKSIEANT